MDLETQETKPPKYVVKDYTSQLPETPPPAPTTPTPQEASHFKDNFGWLINLPESSFKVVKGVVYDLPKAVLTAGYHYATNPSDYGKDLDLALSKNSGLGSFLKEQTIDNYYNKDIWKNFNEDPARALSDAAAIISLGAGSIGKLAELGKLSNFAKIAGKVGNVGAYLDPVMWAGKGAAKLAAPALEALGYGKYTEQLNAGRALLAARQAQEMNEEITKVLAVKLSAPEQAELLRLIRWGDQRELELAAQANNNVGRAYKAWREIITGGDEPLFKKIHLLSDEQAKNANAIKMAEYSQNHWQELGLQAPLKTTEARALMDAGTHNPTFMSSYRLKSQDLNLFHAFNNGDYRGGMLSRFENTVGGKNVLEDVEHVMAKQIATKHDALLKMRTADFVKGLMAAKGELKFAPLGSEIAEALKKTHAPLQDAFFKKYWADMVQSGGAIAEALTSARNPVEGLAAARAAVEGLPELAKAFHLEGDALIPKHVAAWMNRELAPISPMARLYDSTLARYKGLATVFNPRFWGSVVFGNSMLGLFYGFSPDMARIAYKYRDFLPVELQQIARAEVFMRDKGIYSRVANNLGEFASTLDNMFKKGIFVSEVSKDSYSRLKFAGGEFFNSQASVAKAVQYFGQAPERLMQNYLRIEALKGELTNQLTSLRALQAQEATLGQMVAKAASREGTGKSVEGFNELGQRVERAPESLLPEMQSSAKAVGGRKGPKVGSEYNELGQQTKGPRIINDEVYGPVDTQGKAPITGEILNSKHSGQYDEITGQPYPVRGAGGGSPPKLGPVDTSVDPITGLRVSREPELYGGYEPGRPLTPKQEALVEAVDLYGNLGEQVKQLREDAIHRLAEIGELQRRIPALTLDAGVAERAIQVGNRFYGSYARLSPFERVTLRRLLPFYTFNKAMTSLAFRLPYLYPKRVFIGTHLAQAWNDITSDENSYMPARLRDYVPVAARADGSVVAISSGYLNPLSSAKIGEFSELPLPSVFNPLKSNPVIALLLKMNGAIPEWSAKPLSPGEYATRLDNGTVVQWTGTGFKTVVAQPSVFKSLFDLFPQGQLIDRLMHPYAQTDRGWLFSPDPISGPDGKPRYPRELMDNLLGSVIPVQTYHKEEIQNQEKMKMVRVMQSYLKDLRFATPVRRDQIIEVLNAFRDEKNRKWIQ